MINAGEYEKKMVNSRDLALKYFHYVVRLEQAKNNAPKH